MSTTVIVLTWAHVLGGDFDIVPLLFQVSLLLMEKN